ncbi:SLATT domain-containing protein [Paenibacillus sp. P96]|uniref:SLATT domain-containing protein n=1 Tax=Paenibacillus zeirhizosphaerae TaxID=2987519 RepID=A0ABT9FLN1_9BACL|nr:SLATT domain-containing protein [Paenibacillus sp. P96]MDP4095643.1 SLATT domain-containing protein [Paenibacillus sp. P96]
MNKDDFLKLIATRGYNVYFGAKKHFATYDIIEKLPRGLALFGVFIGVWQLWKPDFQFNDIISFMLVLAGIYAYTITQYDSEKKSYNEAAVKLVQIHNELHSLYLSVKSSNANSFENEETRLQELMDQYYSVSKSKQIFFSHTFAHFKFFGESQIQWMDEQLHFTFWSDKIPKVYKLLFYIFVILLLLAGLAYSVVFAINEI